MSRPLILLCSQCFEVATNRSSLVPEAHRSACANDHESKRRGMSNATVITVTEDDCSRTHIVIIGNGYHDDVYCINTMQCNMTPEDYQLPDTILLRNNLRTRIIDRLFGPLGKPQLLCRLGIKIPESHRLNPVLLAVYGGLIRHVSFG